MSSTTLSKRICKNHNKKIEYVCLNSTCKNNLGCFDCIKGYDHGGHQNSFEKYSNFEKVLEQKRSICNNLLQQLDDIINQILCEFYRLREGIENKYNLTIERINKIDNIQFNQYMSSIIQLEEYKKKEYQNKKLEPIEIDKKNITIKLNNYLTDLELDKLIYLEISEEDYLKTENLYSEGFARYYERNNPKEAIKLFDQALIYHPKHIWSLWCKGVSLSKLGKQQEAVQCYDKVLAIDPENFLSLIEKRKSLSRMNILQQSISKHDELQVPSLVGKKNSESEWPKIYEIDINFLDKYHQDFVFEPFTTIDEIIDCLIESYQEQLGCDKSRVVIKSNKLNRQLSPKETVRQILQDQAQDKFDIKLKEQNGVFSNQFSGSRMNQNCFNPNPFQPNLTNIFQNQAQSLQQEQDINVKMMYKNQGFTWGVDPTCSLKEFYSYAVNCFSINEKVQMVLNHQNLSNLPDSTQFKDLQIKNGDTIYFMTKFM